MVSKEYILIFLLIHDFSYSATMESKQLNMLLLKFGTHIHVSLVPSHITVCLYMTWYNERLKL